MILVCSACHTRYQVDDRALARPSGRTVRCASCGHSWLHRVPRQPPPMRVVEAVAEPAAPAATPRAAITASEPQRRRHAVFGWLVLLVVIVAVAAAGIVEREAVAALWPPAARFYELIHLKIAPLGAGLAIGNVGTTRNADGLIVEGDVTNRVATARTMPRLRVVLRGADQKELAFKVIPPPRERLMPGETAHFVVAFLPASDGAAKAEVTFTR